MREGQSESNQEEDNVLGTKFTFGSLGKYVLPTILMMIISSMYMIIDGLFVANLVGEDALAAINIISPIFGVMMSVALMFSTGGTAIIGRFMGEGKGAQARQFVSVLYIIAAVLGGIVTIVMLVFPTQIASVLGAEGILFDYSQEYIVALAPFIMMFFFQMFAQSFFVVAGKPGLGFVLSILGGLVNVVFDYVLISPQMFDLGIQGAAVATGLGATISGLAGFIYLSINRKGTLYFEKPKWVASLIREAMSNGLSELVGNLAVAVTTFLMNIILLRIAGDAGIAAISVILYVQMMQNAFYFGYAIGVSPIISYKYGEKNHKQLKEVIQMSFKFISVASLIIVVCSLLFAETAVNIFISRDSETFQMAVEGFRLFSIAYLFNGFNIFFSSLFTALSNGKISALISVSRTLVFLAIMLIILPMLFGLTGVWISVPVAEVLAIGVGVYFYRKNRTVYHY